MLPRYAKVMWLTANYFCLHCPVGATRALHRTCEWKKRENDALRSRQLEGPNKLYHEWNYLLLKNKLIL